MQITAFSRKAENPHRDPRQEARALFEKLQSQGFTPQEILSFSSELLSCVAGEVVGRERQRNREFE